MIEDVFRARAQRYFSQLGDCAFGDAHDLLLAARRIYSRFAVRFAEAVHDPALRRRVFRLPPIFLREFFRLNDFVRHLRLCSSFGQLFACFCFHNPLGKVSSTSPTSHSTVRSSGSTARV